MELTQLDKMNCNKIISSYGTGNFYISDFFPSNKKVKYNESDVLDYILILARKDINSTENKEKHLSKVVSIIETFYFEDYITSKQILEIDNLRNLYLKSTDNPNEYIINTLNKICKDLSLSEEETNEILKEQIYDLKEKLQSYETQLKELDKNYQSTITTNKKLEARLKLIQRKFEQKSQDLVKAENEKDRAIQSEQELKRQLEEKINEIKAIDSQLTNLQLAYDQICNELKAITENNLFIERRLSDEMKAELLKQINELEQKLARYQESCKKAYQTQKELNDNLDKLKEQNNKLNVLLEIKEQKIKELEIKLDEKKENLSIRENRLKEIERIIIRLLLTNTCSINKVISEAQTQNITVSVKEALELINKVGTKMAILPNTLTVDGIGYAIDKTAIRGQMITILPTNNCLEFFAFGDLHGKKFDRSGTCIKEYEKCYQYCVDNNISYMLNLGDFFDVSKRANSVEEEYYKVLKQVEYATKYIPSVDGIHQLILGGNHEENFLPLGINVLDLLSKQRPDIINLGYRYANINVGNNQLIMLHHLANRAADDVKIPTNIVTFVNEYYKKNAINTNNVCFKLFAHFHLNSIDSVNRLASIPSLTKDRFKNGAHHIKIYFDENGNIDNILIILLTNENKLLPTAQVNVGKTLIKK